MEFLIRHTNLNVLDLDKSLAFYQKALGLREVRRKQAGDDSFTLVYLSDERGLSRSFSASGVWLHSPQSKGIRILKS